MRISDWSSDVCSSDLQNVQVSGGSIGAPPNPGDNAFQYVVSTQGRFEDPREFRAVIVKSGDDGRLVRLQDVARVELGARAYITNSYLTIGGAPGCTPATTAPLVCRRSLQTKNSTTGRPKNLQHEIHVTSSTQSHVS